MDSVSTRFDRRAFNLDFPASCGQSRRNLISRLNRAVRPQKSATESPTHLGCSRRKPRRDRRFHSPLTPRPLRVIRSNAGGIKRTPIRRIPVGEPRPPLPASSAAGTARRTRWPSQGGFAVTLYLENHCEPTSPPALACSAAENRPSNTHSHPTYHHRGSLRMLCDPHNTRPQSKGIRRNSLPDSRFFARLTTRPMSVLRPKSPQ